MKVSATFDLERRASMPNDQSAKNTDHCKGSISGDVVTRMTSTPVTACECLKVNRAAGHAKLTGKRKRK